METSRPTNLAVPASPPEVPNIGVRELRIDERRIVSGGQAAAAPRLDILSFGNTSGGGAIIK